ncbi:MAG: S49 family peptidase, partial [Phycisphaerales bacterium]|nr:S49 family peptidase [Phycisphaerales bacterium]
MNRWSKSRSARLFFGVCAVFGVISGAAPDTHARQSVIAHVDLSKPITEVPQEMPPLFASEMPSSFKDLLVRLRDAREDKNVVAVILNVENAALGLAQMEEVRKSVEKIKAAGKPVYVHADGIATGEYALASCASDISITPTGDVWLTGIYGESPYLRGMLDKMGVVPDFLQCGDFKSAGEMFMRTGPSESAEKMENWLFDSIYDSLVGMIAQGRGSTPDKVKALIDGGPYTAEDALKAGVIDAVEHRQDFIARLK